MPLANPYPKPPPGQDNHLLQGRVAEIDYLFLKKRLCYTTGLNDIIVSTLYKKFIDELRRIDATDPIPSPLHLGDATYQRIEAVLDALNFGPRVDTGGAGGRDVERDVSGVREEMLGASEQRADEKGGNTGRRRGKAKNGERAKEK